MRESEVQRAILDYLRYRGILHARTNAGRRGGVHLAPKGWPDITAMYRGRFVGIEVKSSDGTLRDAQIEALLLIRDGGGIAIAARDVADVARMLV